ncbi:MAG: HU family DNA-binding protein [Candidatus Flemingiibacterium sp.]
MNKTNLTEEVVKATGLKKKEAEAAVNAVFSTIEAALIAGEKVQLVGFGTFEVKERGERLGVNPATGAKITIPASRRLNFSVGKTLKASLNEKK